MFTNDTNASSCFGLYDYDAFGHKSPCCEKLRIFGVWQANQSAPSAFSTVSVHTTHKFWKLSKFFYFSLKLRLTVERDVQSVISQTLSLFRCDNPIWE